MYHTEISHDIIGTTRCKLRINKVMQEGRRQQLINIHIITTWWSCDQLCHRSCDKLLWPAACLFMATLWN